jgi:hypothetical protein
MLEWFLEWFSSVSEQVKVLPVYFAAPIMIFIGALDSSLLSLPEVNDYITAYRVAHNPSEVYYFPLFPAIGSVIGCLILYRIAQRGEQFVTKRFHQRDLPQVGNLRAGHSGPAPPADAIQDFRGGGGRVELPGGPFCHSHNDRANRTVLFLGMGSFLFPRGSFTDSGLVGISSHRNPRGDNRAFHPLIRRAPRVCAVEKPNARTRNPCLVHRLILKSRTDT